MCVCVVQTLEYRREAESHLLHVQSTAGADSIIPEAAVLALNHSATGFSSRYSATGYELKRFILNEMKHSAPPPKRHPNRPKHEKEHAAPTGAPASAERREYQKAMLGFSEQ